jgi:hypothetical protein
LGETEIGVGDSVGASVGAGGRVTEGSVGAGPRMHAVEIPRRATDKITQVLSLRMVDLLLEERSSLQDGLWTPGAGMSTAGADSGGGSE